MNPLENILGAVQVGGVLILSPLLRGWYNGWGATLSEKQNTLPGDELVLKPVLGYTHAITIRASVEKIWPWLVQMGQGRGGLYSYDGLENIAGCKIHSADRIIPELQNPQVGELIRLGPKGYPCFKIASIDPCRSLVLISADPKTEEVIEYKEGEIKGYSAATWQFVLEPVYTNETRLLIRQRLTHTPDMKIVWRITEPIAFVMERKMLQGIRIRSERGR